MSFSMVASHSTGKVLKDVIFGASAACNEAIQKYGADKVTNVQLVLLWTTKANLFAFLQ